MCIRDSERATATQQTGFWFVAQARPDVPDNMGILWFGVDDAATSCLTPIYCSAQEVPACLSEQNGSMLEYSPTSAFWLFNRVTNFAYLRYDRMSKDLQAVADRWENRVLGEVREVTDEAAKRRAIERLALKYAPDDSEANRAAAIDREWGALCVLELRIEHLSGKESTALAKERAKA